MRRDLTCWLSLIGESELKPMKLVVWEKPIDDVSGVEPWKDFKPYNDREAKIWEEMWSMWTRNFYRQHSINLHSLYAMYKSDKELIFFCFPQLWEFWNLYLFKMSEKKSQLLLQKNLNFKISCQQLKECWTMKSKPYKEQSLVCPNSLIFLNNTFRDQKLFQWNKWHCKFNIT